MLANCHPNDIEEFSETKRKALRSASNASAAKIDPIACFNAMWRNRLYGMYVLDVVDGGNDFRFLAFNQAMTRMSPIPTSKLEGKLLSEALKPQDAKRYHQHYSDCIRCGHINRFEEIFVDHHGETTWWVLSVDPVRDKEGEIYQLIVTAADISDERRAKAELQKSQQVLQKVMDTVPFSIFWKDRDSRFLGCNQSFLLTAGLSDLSKIVGKSDYDLIWKKEESDWFRAHDQRVMNNNKAELNIIEPQQQVDGRQAWLKTDKLPLHNSDGEVIGVLGLIEDITEKKRSQDEQQRLLAILEATPDIVGIFDSEGNHQYLNATGCRVFGLTQKEAQQFHISNTTSSKLTQVLLNESLPKAARLGIWRGESEIKDASGKVIPVSQVIICHKNSDGEVAHYSSITRDISDRKAAETNLKKNAARHAVLNQITAQIRNSLDLDTVIATTLMAIHNSLALDYCGFAWLDSDASAPTWSIVQAIDNTDHGLLIGECADDRLGEDIYALVDQQITRVDDVNACEESAHRAFLTRLGIQSEILVPVRTDADRTGVIICYCIQTARTWTEYEVDLLKAVGDQLAIAINQANLYTQSCHQSQQLVHTLDQLKRTQAQIIQAEKMSSLGQMVAGVAHEINNPVNFIYGNLEPAHQYAQDLLCLVKQYQSAYPQPHKSISEEIEEIDLDFIREDLPKLLKSMKIGTERIREIVLSLRNFSRLDEAAAKTVDLHEGIDSTLVILNHRLKSSSAQSSIEVIKQYGTLPLVDCYPSQLNQVLMNILSNAIDALEDTTQPQITLTTQTRVVDGEPFATVRIADNGPGIPEKIQSQILDPFFTTKPVGKGTGMGMSISYQIVTEKHGGTLSFTSKAGIGTEFVVSIPVRQSDVV